MSEVTALGWKVSDSYEFDGKTMLPGTEFSVLGARGARFRFVNHVQAGDKEWVNCVGGTKGVERFRAFRPSQISRITKLVPVEEPPR